MSDHRQGRGSDAGDRNGDDLRRARRLQGRQDFWDCDGEDDAPRRRRAHRRSRVQSTRRTRRLP